MALRSGPLAVGDVVKATRLSQSNVSNHLACLRNCGHVVSKQRSRTVVYSIGSRQIEKLLSLAEVALRKNALGIYECTNM